MYTIATLLDINTDNRVKAIWTSLQSTCQLSGVLLTPTPHFSWVTFKDCPLEGIRADMDALSKEMIGEKVHASGLGIFPSEQPVLYIPLVKTMWMIQMEKRIHAIASKYTNEINPYHDPYVWMPHITLAFRDTNLDKFICALQDLLRQPIEFDLKIENLALLYMTVASIGVDTVYPLKGGQI
jgi:2'-5' RNA ligase